MRVGDKVPVEGTTFDWDIDEIMERGSMDLDGYGDWETMLDEKRADSHYEDVKESLSRWGFVRPLTAYEDSGVLTFGDGHHRLAAAIELGMTTVPVEVFGFPVVAEDSGDWDKNDSIDTVREIQYI